MWMAIEYSYKLIKLGQKNEFKFLCKLGWFLQRQSHIAYAYKYAGADLGFSERGANHSSGSLKQGVWGAQPPRSYRMFCFMKYRNAI